VELLDARLVRDRRMRERAGAARLGRVLAVLPVHEVQLLGLRVVRLEIVVGDRPGRRDAAVVADLAEVALAEPEEDRAVHLRVAADVVLGVRTERDTVLVVPLLLRDVALLAEDLTRVPVLGLARQVAAPLEDQHAQAGRSEPVGERAAPRAAPDDDHVEIVHARLSFRRGRSARPTRRWLLAASDG
jgi:hypothetical protein